MRGKKLAGSEVLIQKFQIPPGFPTAGAAPKGSPKITYTALNVVRDLKNGLSELRKLLEANCGPKYPLGCSIPKPPSLRVRS